MNIFMFWINENGGKTVTSLILGALIGLRDMKDGQVSGGSLVFFPLHYLA